MALSAFGDPISEFGDPLDDEPQQPVASQPAPTKAVSAFGDDLHDEPAPHEQDGIDPMQLYYGAAHSVDQMGLAAGRILGLPVATAFDKLRSMFSDQPTTAAQDALNQHVLTPLQQRADSLVPAPDASFGNKLLNAGGGFAGNLAAMAATGGLSRAPAMAEAATSVFPGVANQVGQAARTMAVPALTDAINTGHDVAAETGDLTDAMKAAIASGAANVGMGLLPMSAPGNLLTRVATGAPRIRCVAHGAGQY